MLALGLAVAVPATAVAGGDLSVTTGDGLSFTFGGRGALKSAAVRGRPLAPPAAANGRRQATAAGFSYRSYTAPSVAAAEMLQNPTFSKLGGSPRAAADWAPSGGGYTLEGGALVLSNHKTNTTSMATQTVPLPTGGLAAAAGALRLTGWASAERLQSDGTCADEGSCVLSDTFGLVATLVFADGSRRRSPLTARAARGGNLGDLPPPNPGRPVATFLSGTHGPQYSFAVVDLVPLAPEEEEAAGASGGAGVVHVVTAVEIGLVLAGYAGTVRFHNCSLVPFPATSFAASIATASTTAINATAISIASLLPATSPRSRFGGSGVAGLPLQLQATVAAHPRHLRIDGRIALLDGGDADGESSSPRDEAVTVSFGVPVGPAATPTGWSVGTSPDESSALAAAATAPIFGHRDRGYYDGRGEEGTVEGMDMAPPFASDWYPLLTVTAADDADGSDAAAAAGVAVAVPMERVVYISRAEYRPADRLLVLSFDLALTGRSTAFSKATSFSLLVYSLDHPSWGFRSGLEKYYALHPQVYGPAATISDQGNWLPFMSTTDVANYTDFGFKFQEGGSGGAAARTMNSDGCGIYPYIEPHVIHWPVNHSGPCHTRELWTINGTQQVLLGRHALADRSTARPGP
jgi:hypothetical protein